MFHFSHLLSKDKQYQENQHFLRMLGIRKQFPEWRLLLMKWGALCTPEFINMQRHWIKILRWKLGREYLIYACFLAQTLLPASSLFAQCLVSVLSIMSLLPLFRKETHPTIIANTQTHSPTVIHVHAFSHTQTPFHLSKIKLPARCESGLSITPSA